MNKRQKCSSTLSNINILTNTNSNDNPILSSNLTNNNKEDLSLSSSNDTTIVNDTVPNWVQSGGQVS
jgi:hypothetical protein